MEFISEFSQTWSNPQMRHAMFVHMPIALSLLCVVAALWSAIVSGKNGVLRWIVIGLTAALALSALGAKLSGEAAKDTVAGALTEEGDEVLDEHEALGEKVWALAAAACVFGAVTLSRSQKLRVGASWGAAALSIVTAVWTANTGHHGGKLVYAYGAVTPTEVRLVPEEPTESVPVDDVDDIGDPRAAFFRSDVLPLLQANCLRCHNDEKAKRAGGLNQTTMGGILTGGISGPALVPGKPDESLIIEAISWDNEDLQMPPMGKLADEEIAALRTWIRDGAVWTVP